MSNVPALINESMLVAGADPGKGLEKKEET